MQIKHACDHKTGLRTYTNDPWHEIIINKQYHHAINCISQIPHARELNIPQPVSAVNQTVIIENRKLPHIEYIIRKVVHLMGPNWGHCVICSNTNHEFIKSMCNNISNDIQVINANEMGLAHEHEFGQNVYNNMMLSKPLWEALTGEKILVYQQDTDINHGGIDMFMEYDYVGAPWPVGQDDNELGVGNGGFSLRTRQVMIDCLNTHSPKNLIINDSTRNYMNGLEYLDKPLDYPPEDVFYSKTMLDYGIGRVAPRDVGYQFSSETTWYENSLGMHQPWMSSTSRLYWPGMYNTYKLYTTTFSKGDARQHAGGWPDVIHNLEKAGVLHEHGNINLLDCTEQYFVWDNNQPMTSDWVGIIHITPNTPDYLDIVNVNTLLTNRNYIASLPWCKGLIVMSEYLKSYIEPRVNNIPVLFAKHPVDLNSMPPCNIDRIVNDPDTCIVQVGQQMRYMSTLYRVNTTRKKLWLSGWKEASKMKTLLGNESTMLQEYIDPDSVELKYVQNPDEYKYIVSNNIVVVNVIDASANNAILEMIAGNIPVLINKHPAVQEYLGETYPCYYSNVTHLQHILNSQTQLSCMLARGHEYLKTMNKDDIEHVHFAKNLLKFINT